VTRRQPCSFIIKDVRGRLGYWMGDGFKWTRERLLAQRFATQATAEAAIRWKLRGQWHTNLRVEEIEYDP
jgi:hypothetical protein